jgi:hypothetical protein
VTDPVRAIEDRFPKLVADGYGLTSSPTDGYNCVAWVARDVEQWWAPGVDGYHWPLPSHDDSLTNFMALFRSLDFEECFDGVLQPDMEKIAIYGNDDEFEHVAFQRADGSWSSKLGELGDIRHDRLDSIAGPGGDLTPRPRQPLSRSGRRPW